MVGIFNQFARIDVFMRNQQRLHKRIVQTLDREEECVSKVLKKFIICARVQLKIYFQVYFGHLHNFLPFVSECVRNWNLSWIALVIRFARIESIRRQKAIVI